jgi:hypothetical protein
MSTARSPSTNKCAVLQSSKARPAACGAACCTDLLAGDGQWLAGRARRSLAALVNGSGRPYANDGGSDGTRRRSRADARCLRATESNRNVVHMGCSWAKFYRVCRGPPDTRGMELGLVTYVSLFIDTAHRIISRSTEYKICTTDGVLVFKLVDICIYSKQT